MNIKNLLECNPSYAKSVGTNEFYFPDSTIHADEIKYTRRQVTHRRNAANNGDEAGLMLDDVNVNYNKGFAARKKLLGLSAEVNCEIPLNRYSFFEALEDKLLPNTKIELSIEFDDDKNLIWRQGAADAAGTSYRLIIKRLQLFVPRLVFNSEEQKLYVEDYLKPYKWTYLKETCSFQICQNKIQVISESQMAFPNQDMFLYFLSIMPILTINLKIHFCITPSVYLTIQEL